ncbi:hypothetical protein RI367_004320 [Sorochytrium milnesiophthora]
MIAGLESDSGGDRTPLLDPNASATVSANSLQHSRAAHEPSLLWRRLRYYIPVLHWLPKYRWSVDFPHDLIAGTTVSFMLVPQGLSYASSLAKLHPIYGLYCAFTPVIAYGLFGTSRQLSLGPSALIMLLVGSTVAKVQEELHLKGKGVPPIDPAVIASSLGLLVGFFTFVFGIFRFGFLDSVLSRALLRGFITAIAVVIMIEQSSPLLGIQLAPTGGGGSQPLPPHMSPLEKLFRVIHLLHTTHTPTLILSACSASFLAIVGTLKTRMAPRVPAMRFIPEILLLVIISTALSAHFNFQQYGIQILGSIGLSRGTIPAPSIPLLLPLKKLQIEHLIRALTMPAMLISIIGFVESIAAAKQYASRHNYSVSRNRELVALGVSNIVGSLFHAVPAYGSLTRSRVNDRMGARTQMAGFVAGTIILLTILFLLPLFNPLPIPAMASIILIASFSLIELDDFRFIYRIRAWKDLLLLAFTFFTTLLVSIEAGTLLSIALSLMIVVKHTTLPRLTVLGRVQGAKEDRFRPMDDFPDEAEHVEGTLIIKIEESLHFSNTSELRQRLGRVERFGDLRVHPSEHARLASGAVMHVVFEVSNMHGVDATALHTLVEVVENYHRRHVVVSFVKLRPALRKQFDLAGITDVVGADAYFRRVNDAVDRLSHTGPPPAVVLTIDNAAPSSTETPAAGSHHQAPEERAAGSSSA